MCKNNLSSISRFHVEVGMNIKLAAIHIECVEAVIMAGGITKLLSCKVGDFAPYSGYWCNNCFHDEALIGCYFSNKQ